MHWAAQVDFNAPHVCKMKSQVKKISPHPHQWTNNMNSAPALLFISHINGKFDIIAV